MNQKFIDDQIEVQKELHAQVKQLQANLDATKRANAYLHECHGNWSADAIRWKNKCEALQAEVEAQTSQIRKLKRDVRDGDSCISRRELVINQLQDEVERLRSEQQGEMWYALDCGFEGQYYELGCVIEDFESDANAGDIEEVKVAQLTTVKHPNKFLAKLWVDGDARLFDTREEAQAAIDKSMEQAND